MTYTFERIGEVSTSMMFHQDRRQLGGEMTVAVVGIPRGGTTMVAAAVDALGVDMGPRDDMAAFHFEDQTMNRVDLDVRFKYVKQRNSEHAAWGWKDPTGIDSVRKIMFAVRNPRVIVVFRDMLATIQGEMRFDDAHEIDPRRGFEQLVDMTLHWWTGLLEFVTHTQVPTMLVSYERAIADPDLFVHELASFLGVDANQAQRDEVLARISPTGGYIILPSQGQGNEDWPIDEDIDEE
jgi:hypothetical protein